MKGNTFRFYAILIHSLNYQKNVGERKYILVLCNINPFLELSKKIGKIILRKYSREKLFLKVISS